MLSIVPWFDRIGSSSRMKSVITLLNNSLSSIIILFSNIFYWKISVIENCELYFTLSLFVTTDSINLIKELGVYSWQIDKDGNSLEKPVKMADDLLDALRYATFDNQKIKISLAKASQKKNDELYGFDCSIHRGYSDSSFRGFE